MTEEGKLSAESDTIVLPPSGVIRWLVTLFCMGGVVAGALTLKANPIFGVCVMVICGLLAVPTTLHLWPGAAYLEMTREGFEVRDTLCCFFVPWKEVEEFSVEAHHKAGISYGNKRLVFKLTESSALKGRFSSGPKWAQPADADSYGVIPHPYGGFSLEELASRLDPWRRNTLGSEMQDQA